MVNLSQLETWYAANCDGEWEHSYGVTIETLDNPGWIVKIDLHGTRAAGENLEPVRIDRSESDWITYRVTEGQFRIACGPKNLSESIAEFIEWFDQVATA